MKNDIKKLLGLQHLWVDGWEIHEREIIVKCRSPRTSHQCPLCLRSVKRVHQYHRRCIKHTVWENKTVTLLLTKRRFYCNACKKPFTEQVPGMSRKRSTKNFRGMLLKNLCRQSLSYVTQQTSASSQTLYAALEEYASQLQSIDWEAQGKDITIGVDEHSFSGKKMALTITNISQKKLLAIGINDRVTTLKKYLNSFEKQRISEVCIDMKQGFLNAVREVLPHALVTVDKFHVISFANRVLDEERSMIVGKKYQIRKTLFTGKEKLTESQKEKLQKVFTEYQRFPSLYEAYVIKEQIRNMYRSKNRNEGRKNLGHVMMLCRTAHSRFIKDFGQTLKRWEKEILNYFERHSTNAFTEGCHTKIKMMKRVSFGFRNIHHYIAKMMLAFVPLLMLHQHTV